MRLRRERFIKGSHFCVNFKLQLTNEELLTVRAAKLQSVKIQLYAGSLIGSTLVTPQLINTFAAQIGKVKNRWSAAMVRTTGFVLFDTVIIYLKAIFYLINLLLRILVGGRRRFSDLLTRQGLTYKTSRIEELKEAEVFVLTSLAAVHEAMKFASKGGDISTFEGDEFRAEIAGLNFSGGEGGGGEFVLASGLVELASGAIDSLSDN